jgi:hypothetical protein
MSRKLFCTATVVDISAFSLQESVVNEQRHSQQKLPGCQYVQRLQLPPVSAAAKAAIMQRLACRAETLATEGGRHVSHAQRPRGVMSAVHSCSVDCKLVI